ncbi:serine phosphatase RsbU (regulator of sigma subunit)/DNA-binding NarL/FixJ family response regulator [Actinoalloteichus hoggarensis]|uniref:Phosphoserine phosphatase RsbU n=1 Tax=Actinoalloteichus hoggarensis TaxID=1470176 RepID=A0A221W5Z2_9PSEU|nr:fused response regulator/phosphatase [Actinoalloteichus hoggarensis]ASO21340.1 Phosphoserine phosphatase RsbU [Actinoalloteichus hoggarensis]MBB5921273.1 serine phosphatase RsbU (regulator of sigma subunit)/DNA-binding NarL/FixJ family response regulator [Actinoalloteichus hoggarensis]
MTSQGQVRRNVAPHAAPERDGDPTHGDSSGPRPVDPPRPEKGPSMAAAARQTIEGDTAAGIMVVGDSATTQRTIAPRLRQAGHPVAEARTGADCLRLLEQKRFTLVILAVDLPDMAGAEVLKRIKADPVHGGTAVIHLTSEATTGGERAQGMTRGVDAYLTEPVDPDELVATVDAALRRAGALAVVEGRHSSELAIAEERVDRLGGLTQAMAAVNAATDFDGVVAAAALGLTAIFPGRASALALRPDGWCRLAVVDGPDETITTRIVPSDLLERLGDHAEQVAEDIATAVLDGTTWSAEVISTPTDDDTRVLLCQWQAEGPPVCLAITAVEDHGAEEQELLWQLGRTFALAVGGLRSFAAEHSLALTLQRSLLPTLLPRRTDFDMAVRYVPAASNAEVGGDFYEVTEWGSDLLVAIGDVTGHSIKAATIMGEVRHALRAFAVEGHRPDVILDLLNRMMLKYHPEFCVTMCLLLIDTVTGEAAVANAGHIPPLLVDAEGARFAPVNGPLLGIALDRPGSTSVRIPVGTTVILLTDGLVEDRVTDLDEAMTALAEVATTAAADSDDLEDLCEQLITEFGTGKDDDIALLALRRLAERPRDADDESANGPA